jgi:hypothetical protein
MIMIVYDAVIPGNIPAGASACLYYDGDWPATQAEAARFAAVRWITVTGDYAHCGIADYEKGNAVFSQDGALRAWVTGRRSMGKRARVYCDRSNYPEVQELLVGTVWELWVATLDGQVLTAAWAPNLWAVQYAGGQGAPFDVSVLYGTW